jgi:hypothetical protein
MALEIAGKPRRKNPVLRTPLPTLPPGSRSRAASGSRPPPRRDQLGCKSVRIAAHGIRRARCAAPAFPTA